MKPAEPATAQTLGPSTWNTHPLWSRLDSARSAHWATRWQVKPGADLTLDGEILHARLGWLLAGTAVLEDIDPEGGTLPLQPGDLFGMGVTPSPAGTSWRFRATAPDTRVAFLAGADLQALVQEFPALAAHFWLPQSREPAPGLRPLVDSLMGMPVQALLARGAVALTPQASVGDAARCMREAGVSSLLITEQAQGQGALLGLVTDRDLRNRVVAEGLAYDTPVMQIATRKLHTLPAQAPVFDALMLMARHAIQHVPVTEGQRVLGVLSAGRLNEQHTSSPLALSARVHRQDNVQGLAGVAAQVGTLQRQLAAADVSAYNSGRMISAITDAITVRLIELAEAQLGPPPVPYVWVAAGSQGRAEQTARTDQDNCMLIDDAYSEAQHAAYFNALAHFVCDGLNACGYVYCPGEMMAKTDTWRQPRRRWREYFDEWLHHPQPKALMLTCVFFDLRAVHGPAELLDGLRREMLDHSRGNSIFLAHMASNALGHTPALGLFGRLTGSREHPGAVDLKHHGVVPIVDLVRVYALSGGLAAVNTQDRLRAVGDGGEVSAEGARDLSEAMEFIAALRLRHQARQMAAGNVADNLLPLGALSSFERSQLKQAFGVVHTLQSVMAQRYTAGRF